MNNAGRINSVNPPYAVAGGEITIECENFIITPDASYGCVIGGKKARLTTASTNRIIAVVPEDISSTQIEIYLESGNDRSEPFAYTVGKKLADNLHIVGNPAVDPKDDSIIVTRSGSRGQKLPVTLLRLEKDGYLGEMPADFMNPTGIAFNRSGNLFVTNRADGEVCRVNHDEEVVPYAVGLGIASGIAFDGDDVMYVGDRSGTIYKVTEFGVSESFAILEPSVSAYHLAFGTNGKLFVTAPGLASFDAVYTVDAEGYDEVFFRGFGRPQGLAFDRDGNLYVAAAYRGRRGIVRVSADASQAEMFVAGNNIIGLCFTRAGELIAATGDSVFSVPVGVYGNILK